VVMLGGFNVMSLACTPNRIGVAVGECGFVCVRAACMRFGCGITVTSYVLRRSPARDGELDRVARANAELGHTTKLGWAQLTFLF
jgi:hypothetical protein